MGADGENQENNAAAFFGRRIDGTQASKKGIGAVWPQNAIASLPGLTRYEPFLTPQKFKKKFFFGIPLKSPITNETISNDDLKDYLQRAANLWEMDSKVNIVPVIKRWRLPFDPNMYYQFIALEIPDKPIQQVISFAITSASYTETGSQNEANKYPRGAEIYDIPMEWVDMGNAIRGLLNVNPINPAFSAICVNSSITASGETILQFVGLIGFVPSYWNIEAVIGMGSVDGQVPLPINEGVGLKATMLILDNLIPQYRFASQSLNIDGEGQSVNDLFYQLLKQKRDQAQIDYDHIVQKIKALTSSKVFSSNV